LPADGQWEEVFARHLQVQPQTHRLLANHDEQRQTGSVSRCWANGRRRRRVRPFKVRLRALHGALTAAFLHDGSATHACVPVAPWIGRQRGTIRAARIAQKCWGRSVRAPREGANAGLAGDVPQPSSSSAFASRKRRAPARAQQIQPGGGPVRRANTCQVTQDW